MQERLSDLNFHQLLEYGGQPPVRCRYDPPLACRCLCVACEEAKLLGSELKLDQMSGVLSLAFGVFLVYHLGFVSGLFTGHPSWTPH